jgi:hypothetical protein
MDSQQLSVVNVMPHGGDTYRDKCEYVPVFQESSMFPPVAVTEMTRTVGKYAWTESDLELTRFGGHMIQRLHS